MQSCSHTWGALAGFSMVASPPPPHNGQVGTKAPGWTFIQFSEEVTRIVQNVRPPARCVFVFVFVFVVCRVSVWGESYTGELCMCHLPWIWDSTHTVALLGSEMSRSYTSTSFTTLASPGLSRFIASIFNAKIISLGHFGSRWKFWIASFCNSCFLHVDAVEYFWHWWYPFHWMLHCSGVGMISSSHQGRGIV